MFVVDYHEKYVYAYKKHFNSMFCHFVSVCKNYHTNNIISFLHLCYVLKDTKNISSMKCIISQCGNFKWLWTTVFIVRATYDC